MRGRHTYGAASPEVSMKDAAPRPRERGRLPHPSLSVSVLEPSAARWRVLHQSP